MNGLAAGTIGALVGSERRVTRLRRLYVLACVCLLLSSVAAKAQNQPDDDKYHLELAVESYRSGHYEEAVREFKVAYSLNPLPAIHYNLGQAYRNLGRHQEALGSYELYLRADPDISAETRARVEKYVEELRARVRPLAPRPVYKRWWFWGALGLVAAGAITGVVVGTTYHAPAHPPDNIPFLNPSWPAATP